VLAATGIEVAPVASIGLVPRMAAAWLRWRHSKCASGPATLRGMSQGHGHTQRYIVDLMQHLSREDAPFIPVRVIANGWAFRENVPLTPSMVSSFRRAALKLAREGVILGWNLPVSTSKGDIRKVLCVSALDIPLTDEGLPLLEHCLNVTELWDEFAGSFADEHVTLQGQ